MPSKTIALVKNTPPIVKNIAKLVPRCRARERLWTSELGPLRTMSAPMMEATMPQRATRNGNSSTLRKSVLAVMSKPESTEAAANTRYAIGAMSEPE